MIYYPEFSLVLIANLTGICIRDVPLHIIQRGQARTCILCRFGIFLNVNEWGVPSFTRNIYISSTNLGGGVHSATAKMLDAFEVIEKELQAIEVERIRKRDKFKR